jgi:hypothetical protein
MSVHYRDEGRIERSEINRLHFCFIKRFLNVFLFFKQRILCILEPFMIPLENVTLEIISQDAHAIFDLRAWLVARKTLCLLDVAPI